jgi:glycosyltransferase involved in cell wall biosynthesis
MSSRVALWRPLVAAERPDVSILVAAFNEEATIGACVEGIFETFPEDAEVLVVDGGHDGTGRVVHDLQRRFDALRYVRNENDRGKGHAIRTGMAQATGRVVAQLDADLQFLPSDLPRLVTPILDGQADVTLGSRFMRGAAREDEGAALSRSLGNRVLSAWTSLLFLHAMSDVAAGIKAWSAEALRPEDVTCDHYAYELEIPAVALRAGLRVVDVPVTTRDRAGGQSKVNVLRDGVRMAGEALRFRLSPRPSRRRG